MIDYSSTVAIILMGAAIVYATRISGYLLGLQVRHIGALRPILETLPGCAMMAVIVPAVRQGTLVEVAALAVVIAIMWKSNNVAIATIAGLIVLFLSPALLS
ncbi:MAG: AzlD domain-containing protein [Pseudomonadota bacterium]